MQWLPAIVFLLQAAAASDPYERGMKALEDKRFGEAVTLLEQAAKADPKSHFAHFHLAYALSMQEQDEQAIASYKKALELKPDLPPAQLNIGLLLLRRNRAAEALPYLEPIAEGGTLNRLAFAEALEASGNAARAEEQYRKAIEKDPKSAAAEAGLGRALAKQGKIADAAPHYQKAAELDPSHAGAMLELASAHEQAKQFKEAIAIYERFPDNPTARERAGELLLESGDAKAAIGHLEAAVQRSATAANRFALATAYTLEKQYDKAEAQLDESLKLEPANTSLRMSYARVLREQKKYAEAAKQFYQVAQTDPASATAWSDLAGMLILLNQDQQALAALDKIRALGAEKAAHFYFRAIILDKQNNAPAALESYEKFLTLSEGKNPDEEFKARQRVRILKKETSKR